MQSTNELRQHFERLGCDFTDGEPRYKASLGTAAVDRKNRLVKGFVSTPGLDLDGEIVLQNFDTSFFPDTHKAVYLDHEYTIPGHVAAVGVCENVASRPEGLYARTKVIDSPLGDEILNAIEEGALRGFSIGFQVLEGGPATPDEMEEHKVKEGTFIARRSKLLEYSFTSMPANADALIKMLSRGKLPAMAYVYGGRQRMIRTLYEDGVVLTRRPS